MSDLKPASRCLVFSSILYNSHKFDSREILSLSRQRIGEAFIFQHPFFPMKDYYSKEMGGDPNQLNRIVQISMNTFCRSSFISEKIWADGFEKQITSSHGYRSINIDIGILNLENVLLATGKMYSHRIFIDKGVYADLTYQFSEKSYVPLSWTYPDYRHQDYLDFFNFCRNHLLRNL